jgi:phenylacetate-CoA ligase
MVAALHLPEKGLKRLRDRRLRRAVRRAYRDVPYYRKLFDGAGIRPEDIRTMEDLPAIPITRKEDLVPLPVRERVRKGTDLGACLELMTSGSSGAPFRIWLNAEDKRTRVLSDIRSLWVNGLGFTDRTLLIVDPSHIPENKFWFQRAGILDRDYLSLYAEPAENLQALAGGGYQAIRGLTAELRLLSSEILERDLRVPGPRRVFTCADLLDPLSRRLIRQAFGTDPIDYYGAMEFGFIAWQCDQRTGYHVNADLMELEVVDHGGPCPEGRTGEVVMTNFFSDTAPLIRYSLGDLAVPSSRRCPCGCPFPMIESIQGRLVDRIRLPSGKTISPYPLICAVEAVPGLKGFQVVQRTTDKIIVNYVSEPETASRTARGIVEVLGPHVGDAILIQPERVEEIPRPPGKFRLVLNSISQEREQRGMTS